MKYFITIDNNIITGLYYSEQLLINKNYKIIDSSYIDTSEILVGDSIDLYNTDWKLNEPKNNRCISVPVEYFSNTEHYSISILKPLSVEGNVDYIVLSIGLICCDKDYQRCQETINFIKSWNIKNYEIIIIDNCVEEKPSFKDVDVIHIKTNKNMYPFAGRQIIAENAKGKYLWYIDGDDNISEPNLYWLINGDYDVLSFALIPETFQERQVNDLVDFCCINQVVDGTLHKVMFNKRIYKQALKEWGEKVIWYYEDTFYLYYFLCKSKTLAVISQEIYKYDKLNGGLVFRIQNIDDLKKLCINAKDMVSILESGVLGKYEKLIENQYYFGMEYFLGIHNLIEYKGYINDIFPYTTTYTKQKEKYEDFFIPKEIEKTIDIIYIFYGTDYLKEISYLKSRIHCNYNLIIIDYFNSIVDVNSKYRIIHHTTLKNDLTKAAEYINNNVWILESYKKVFPFSGNLIFDKTTVYSNINESIKTQNFECKRNNIIFSKNDFKTFINNVENLQSLEYTTHEYLKNNIDYPIWSLLVEPAPIDDRLLYNLKVSENIYITDYKIFLKLLSSTLCFNKNGISWQLEPGKALYDDINNFGIQKINDLIDIKLKINSHKKIGLIYAVDNDINVIKRNIKKLLKKFKYIFIVNTGDKLNNLNLSNVYIIEYIIDYYHTVNKIKSLFPNNKIIDITDKIYPNRIGLFTFIFDDITYPLLETCWQSWDNLRGFIEKKRYTLKNGYDLYLKDINKELFSEKELQQMLIKEISLKNGYTYIPYDTYYSEPIICNSINDIKPSPILDLSLLKNDLYYVININLWNKYTDFIKNNFDNKYIVYNNTDIKYIEKPEIYIECPKDDFIYFSELQRYINLEFGNKIKLINIQSKDFLFKVLNE